MNNPLPPERTATALRRIYRRQGFGHIDRFLNHARRRQKTNKPLMQVSFYPERRKFRYWLENIQLLMEQRFEFSPRLFSIGVYAVSQPISAIRWLDLFETVSDQVSPRSLKALDAFCRIALQTIAKKGTEVHVL